MIVGALTCALLDPMCDLKTAQMNMQSSFIWEHMLYEFELGHIVVEETKNIFVKGEDTGDHSILTRWLKKFHSRCKNLGDEASPGKLKTVDPKAVLQLLEANLVSRTQ